MNRVRRVRPAAGTPPEVHPTAVVDPGAQLGPGCKIWHFCHVMEGAVLGAGVVLGQGCFVGAGVTIGAGCRIQNHVQIFQGVALGEDVFVGPGVTFTNLRRPRAAWDARARFADTRVLEGATLGAASVLLPGVTVGRFALVGAGAVVTRSVRDFSQVQGVPARAVGWVSRAGAPLELDANGEGTCPEFGDRYRLHLDQLTCLDER